MTEQQGCLRILVIPLNAHGHINACHGLCDELRDRGHKIIFLLDEEFTGRLSIYGFEERYIKIPKPDNTNNEIGFWQNFVAQHAEQYVLSPSEQMTELIPVIFRTMFDQQKIVEDEYQKAIADIKPDLIINDCYICCPAIVNSGIPWVWLYSATPHSMLQDPRLPPYYSGLPYNGDKHEWKKFRQNTMQSLFLLLDDINEYCVSKGVASLNNRLHPLSPYLNLYMWPRELRYPELDQLPSNIIGVDCFVRTIPDQKFEIPEKIRDRPGKLIFFSMGSFGCSNLKLMTRLVNILGKCPHRFIVAKGPLKYDLADNMYGEPFVPQTAILPIVDLVITHGGNNTVTETFFYGKKMLILETFCDQFDNAQRIVEVGLGDRLNPFSCSETELLETIERLLEDENLTKRMAEIGERIRDSKDKQKVANYIEKMLL